MKIRISLIIFYTSLIFFLGFAFGNSQKQVEPVSLPSPATYSQTLGVESATSQVELFIVRRIIDGDTIELTDGRKLRYIGIDTPETVDPNRDKQCFGKEASDKNKELVEGKLIELEKDVSETDRFGRLLRYVYVEIDGQRQMVNEYLVKSGYAFARSYPPDVKYQELLRFAENKAREENQGLWAGCDIDGDSTAEVSQQTPVALSPSGECVIKGNISVKDKIYHLPGCGSYEKTVIDETRGEKFFCTEEQAQKEGFRKAENC